jgi:membrane protease YdiL (CAAX protease family)
MTLLEHHEEVVAMIARLTQLLKRYPLIAGFVMMFAFTWPVDLALAAQSRGIMISSIVPILAIFVGYGFVAAALIMTGMVEGRAGIRALLRGFLVWRVGVTWYIVALFGPAAMILLALGIHVLLGGAAPDFSHPMVREILGPSVNLWYAAAGWLLFGILTNGEEIGWRGYALPRLQARYNAVVASLIIGVIWALWHLPKFWAPGSAQNYPFWMYLLALLPEAILYTWVYNNTRGSLLLVTLLHAAVNAATMSLPDTTGDLRLYWVEIGVRYVVAIIIVLVAGPDLVRKPKPVRVTVPEPA